MTARVVGEYGEVGQVEFIGEVSHAPGMFVAAMQENDGAAYGGRCCRPVSIEQAGAIVAREIAFVVGS